eukprot:gene33135-55715_t
MSYTAPVKDMLFAIKHLARIDDIAQMPAFEDAGFDTAQAVLEESARFTQEATIDNRAPQRLHDVVQLIGFGGITGEDNAFVVERCVASAGLSNEGTIDMVEGDVLRDWSISVTELAVWPYTERVELRELDEIPKVGSWLWPYRRNLQRRKRFGIPMEELGRPWYEWRELYADRLRTPLSIAFAG